MLTAINTRGKTLFLVTAVAGLILLMFLTTLLWWFISPRLHEFSNIFAVLSLTALRVFFFIVCMGSILILLTCYLERNFLIAQFAVRLSLRIMFPLTILFGELIGIPRDRMRESFVHVNNSFVKALRKTFPPDRILLLLPHCLQNRDCPYRITVDMGNCRRCNKCDIGALLDLAAEFGVKIAIATGGTLARKIIIENKPKFILAIACQRDLVDGMRDVFPIPVFGLLNERPEGPCVNTRVSIPRLRETLGQIIAKP